MHTKDNREREVKFYLPNFQDQKKILEDAGAHLIKNRVHELNYRFDTGNNSLKENHQVLRLRKDDQNHLTFKDQNKFSEGIADRRELEIIIDNLDTTRSILEALGFSIFIIYEKYRTTYHLNQCEIVLDKLPFGYFLEIEGTSAASIQTTAAFLELDWGKRITLSYLELFYQLKVKKNLQIDHILFKSFKNLKFEEADFI